jgi:hypothetical protein
MYVPTRRLEIQNPDDWEAEVRAFAAEIATSEGTRQPCFEVWYPAPDHLTGDEAAEWWAAQGDTFDAVQVDLDADPADAIATLPPYAEMSA